MTIFFSKVIKAGERLREFNFRKLSQAKDLNFHVDVPDDKGNRIIFQMSRNDDGNWITSTPSLPGWILHIEQNLNEAIQEQTREPASRR